MRCRCGHEAHGPRAPEVMAVHVLIRHRTNSRCGPRRVGGPGLPHPTPDVEITRNTVANYIERGLREGHTVGPVPANGDAGAAA